MAAWNVSNNDNLVSREEAISQITDMAKDEGYTGSFKVFYDGQMVADPADLPERVDMDKIRLSETLSQA